MFALSKSTKQAILLYATTILGTVVGILASVINTRALSPIEYGDVKYVNNIIVFISGLIQLPASIPNALGFIFSSILVAGIGLILLSASLAFFFKFMPWTIKGISKLFNKRRAS